MTKTYKESFRVVRIYGDGRVSVLSTHRLSKSAISMAKARTKRNPRDHYEAQQEVLTRSPYMFQYEWETIWAEEKVEEFKLRLIQPSEAG
jgi:hypothetical protein